MTEAVARLLREPSFRAGAERASRHYAGVDGADGCAHAILDFLSARTPDATGAARAAG